MWFGRIPDRANLFRHSVHPLAFRGKRFAPQKLFKLYDDKQTETEVIASVAWQKYLPTEQHIHGYGCRLAFKMNEKKRQQGTFKENSRHIYCGAYQLTAAAVRRLANMEGLDQIVAAEVTHLIEDGEIAHAELRFVFKAGNIDVEGTKTAIVDRLWNACSGPLRHICECDHDVASHPSEDLTHAPLGECTDGLGRCSRFWILARFHICSWFLNRVRE